MAKKPAKPAKKRTMQPAKPTIPAPVAAIFRSRWLELAGKRAPALAGLPPKLVAGLAGLQPVAAGAGAGPEIVVFARLVEGKGCGKMAEIAGWYSMNLAPNGKCIGPVAVKAALDAAAMQVCCTTLECPEECPCDYIPQAKLAAYRCVPGKVEEGFLLQGNRVWNCRCLNAKG